MVNFPDSNEVVRDEALLCLTIEIPRISINVTMTKQVPPEKLFRVTSSSEACIALRSAYENIDWQERFVVACLNRSNKVIGLFTASIGGIASTIADPKIIFTMALNCGASAIVISHNHPSGNTSPSQADKDLTKKMVEAGKLLDLQVLDHIIITRENYFSFADQGILN